jgi:hypothetical protein
MPTVSRLIVRSGADGIGKRSAPGHMTSNRRRRFLPRPDHTVVAIRLPLDSDGLVYRKWGGHQKAKPGDWLVENDGDVYTVDAGVFARTYRPAGRGIYVKTAPVWAERAQQRGSVPTLEGSTRYEAGDYLVSNAADGSDQYAVTAAKFDSLYTLDPDQD